MLMKKHNLFIVLICFLFASCCTSDFLYRVFFWNWSGIDDYTKFPYRLITKSDNPFQFKSDTLYTLKFRQMLSKVTYKYKGALHTKDLDLLLEQTQTTAFIVIKDDHIIIEKYLNGYTCDSINRSFSVAKSITSLLIGIAIDKGFIKSTDDFICDYLIELDKKKYGTVTIKHLLKMEAGWIYIAKGLPWDDDTHLYYEPDVRQYALSHLVKVHEPGTVFHYSNYCTVLLGMILERASKMSITDCTKMYLWSKIGAEFPATWSISREDDGLEQTASGFNARAIDFAKIGKLFLDNGIFNGKIVVSSDWIQASTTPPIVPTGYFKSSGMGENIFYGYHWWGHTLNNGRYNYFSSGHLGQLIYICPSKNIIICRFGKERGKLDTGWHVIAKSICELL